MPWRLVFGFEERMQRCLRAVASAGRSSSSQTDCHILQRAMLKKVRVQGLESRVKWQGFSAPLPSHGGLNAVCDQVARQEAVAHAFSAHGNCVADTHSVEPAPALPQCMIRSHLIKGAPKQCSGCQKSMNDILRLLIKTLISRVLAGVLSKSPSQILEVPCSGKRLPRPFISWQMNNTFEQ